MDNSNLVRSVEEALEKLPTPAGGAAIVMATSSTPPALAVLSTGDIYLSGDTVRVGIHATSSAVERLGDGFTLLVPMGTWAARVEAKRASVLVIHPLALVSGVVSSIRPTAEIPWVLDMSFRPGQTDRELIPGFIRYWHQVRSWLSDGSGNPPQVPLR